MTCCGSWSEKYIDAATGPERRKFFWYIWLGLKQRGTVRTLWLRDMGGRTSHDKPVPPQLTNDDFISSLNAAGFNEKTRAVLMTDSAPAFVACGHPGVVDTRNVNHSEGEFARSIEVVPGKCGPAAGKHRHA